MDKEEIDSLINKKDFSIKDTGLSYRVINNWSEKGLLNHLRSTKGEWHKLTLLELIEVRIYQELKELGFSIKKLKRVKKAFYFNIERKIPSSLDASDINVTLSYYGINYFSDKILEFLNGKNLYLLVRSDGRYLKFLNESSLVELILGKSDLEKMLYGSINSLIMISLKNLIGEMGIKISLSDEDLSKIYRLLSRKETSGKEIRITKNNKGEIRKVRAITDRKLGCCESVNKLVNKPNQRTEFFSNRNGDLAVRIEEDFNIS